MNNPSEFAHQRLLATGRAKDKARRLGWGFLISATLLEVLLGAALVDYWLVLATPLRLGGFILLLLLLAVGVGGWLRLRRRPTSIKEAALDAEAQRPALGCVVSTAAEYLSGERTITHEYEPELVAALKDQAARNLNKVKVSYRHQLSRPAWFLALALITLLVFAAAAPVAFIALKRTVAPWSQETYTKVDVRPGNADIPVGRDLEITNRFSGRIPKHPALRWQEADKPVWQTVELKRSEDGSYLYPFKKLERSVRYQVTGNDAASDLFEITTYVPPEVRELRIHVAYPEYTRVKPFDPPSPNLAVLRASDLTFRILASTRLSKARLRFSSLPAIEFTPGQDDQWTASFKATQDADYWIELADAKGHTGGNEKAYHLKVLPDRPPKVDLLEPGQDIRADATNTIPLKIAATDDFGVSDIKVVYHKLGGPEQTLPCPFTNTETKEAIGGVELPLASLGLREYELVAYHAEAKDNNTLDGPGQGASPVYFIEITHEKGGGKGKPQSDGQKLNLLALQKQIIADTVALAPKAAADKFDELASRQKEAAEFAEIYHDTLNRLGAPAEALQLLDDAKKEMKQASGSLAERKREQALPPEEKALADLYQVLKLLPQLDNLPTQPPPPEEEQAPPSPAVQVALEAIKKKEPPSNEEIAEALVVAKQLSRSQADMVQTWERAEQSDKNASQEAQASKSGAPAKGEKENQQAKVEAKPKGAKEDQKAKAGTKSGEKKPGQEAQSETEPGEGREGQEAKTKSGEAKEGQPAKAGTEPGQTREGQEAKTGLEPGEGLESQDVKQLAELEDQLSKAAAALAEKLQQLAAKDARLGHNAPLKLAQAAANMASAARSLRQGNFGTAGTEGAQSLLNLDKVVALLERLLRDRSKLTDVTAEDFPKEYEALISEYLRKLSHEK